MRKCEQCIFYPGCKDFKDRSRFIEVPCKLGDVLYFLTEEEGTEPFTDEFIPAGSVDSFVVRCIFMDD